jgi:hypothetical protein
MMTEGTLRMQPSGQWAIAAPGREPVPIVAGEVFRLQVRTARGKFMRVRMEHADDRQPRVLVHHVGASGLRRCFKLLQREADFHAKSVGQPRADERLIALSADALDEETGDVVAEVVVLVLGANIAAGLEMPHDAQQLAGRAITWEVHPVMAWQPGLMT